MGFCSMVKEGALKRGGRSDIKQGPDGLLYVLTEEADGALLLIEPVK